MANNCGGDGTEQIEVGPFNQTLFLGCSITDFNMTIGWGAEASTLSVSLVEDRSYDALSNKYSPLNTKATSVNNAPESLPSHALEISGDSVSNDTNKNLHRTIAKEIIDQSQITNLGKARYPSTTDGSVMYSTDPDPGFFGLLYDIIGVAAYFKFVDGLTFGGVITSWSAMGGTGGSATYKVEIRSFSNLLSGAQLIVDKYTGSISTIMTDTIAVPSMTLGDYSGSIKRGNIPNVFNVFGYLESFGFGKSGKTSQGVSALQI